MFGEAFDQVVGSLGGGFVDVIDDFDAGGSELSEAAAGDLGVWVDGGTDDAFDFGVDDCLRTRGCGGVILVRLEGAVDGAAFGGVTRVGDCDGFGVGSGIGLCCTFADDGFAVGSDDYGTDWRSRREAAGGSFRQV